MHGQVIGHGSCLFEDKKRYIEIYILYYIILHHIIYILAPLVLGPNLQLPAHELISPNSFNETLNKVKTVPSKINIFPSGLANNCSKLKRKCSKVYASLWRVRSRLMRMNASIKKENCVQLACLFGNSR